MPYYQLCSCYVALAGDQDQVVYFSPQRPVTLPEVMVLGRLHTQAIEEPAVTEVLVVGYTELRSQQTELQRLRLRYNKPFSKVVDDLWPGATARLPWQDPTLPLAPGVELRRDPGSDDQARPPQQLRRNRVPAAAPGDIPVGAPSPPPASPAVADPDLGAVLALDLETDPDSDPDPDEGSGLDEDPFAEPEAAGAMPSIGTSANVPLSQALAGKTVQTPAGGKLKLNPKGVRKRTRDSRNRARASRKAASFAQPLMG